MRNVVIDSPQLGSLASTLQLGLSMKTCNLGLSLNAIISMQLFE